jgi:hypothetical protein
MGYYPPDDIARRSAGELRARPDSIAGDPVRAFGLLHARMRVRYLAETEGEAVDPALRRSTASSRARLSPRSSPAAASVPRSPA